MQMGRQHSDPFWVVHPLQVLDSWRASDDAGSYAAKFVRGLRAVVEPMLRAGLTLDDETAEVCGAPFLSTHAECVLHLPGCCGQLRGA